MAAWSFPGQVRKAPLRRPADVLHAVEDVGAHLHQLVAGLAPALVVAAHQDDLADVAVLDHGPHAFQGRTHGCLVIDGELYAGLVAGINHPVGFRKVEGHRLFAEHVHAVVGSSDGGSAMLGPLSSD